MDRKLVDTGLLFYNLYRENKMDEVDPLELKTWLAQVIRVLETRASKSKLLEVTDLIKVYMQEKSSITVHQLEMILAFLKAEYESSQEVLRNFASIADLNK